MRWFALASTLLALPLAVQADILVLNDIQAQDGIQLSVNELRQLMPGAQVVKRTQSGSTHRWTNEPEGTFVASSDGRGSSGRSGRAQGTWHVGDNGAYCVTLEWPRDSESWCRYIFKVGEKYFGVKSVADGTTKAHEIEFSR